MMADFSLLRANATAIPLRPGSVHSIVTSPPYYRQRKYDVAVRWPAFAFRPSPHHHHTRKVKGWYGELGWEPHPLDFVGHLLLTFRECYRVLRGDGSLWLNISDKRSPDRQWWGVPDMLVAALVADGWRHEDTVIWHKPSALPGSQTNRFTRDFEFVFVMNKSKKAYFDADAVREAPAGYTRKGGSAPYTAGGSATHGVGSSSLHQMSRDGRTRRAVWSVNPKGTKLAHFAAFPVELVVPMLRSSLSERGVCRWCEAPWQRAARAWHPGCLCYGPPLRGEVECRACEGMGRERRYQRGQQDWTVGGVAEGNPQRDSAHGFTGMPARETGLACPTCAGRGTVIGDIWPDDVGDWPVAPSVVLDPFAGTATVGDALRGIQTGGQYPASFVGMDLNRGYLVDSAQVRLGVAAVKAWGEKREGGDGGEALKALAEVSRETGQLVLGFGADETEESQA